MGSYLGINGIIGACACVNPRTNSFWQSLAKLDDLDVLKNDYTGSIFRLFFDRDYTEEELFAFNSLLNLTITNGPGTLSGKGAKESVSARNNLSTCFTGFLANTGYAHGGNGFEAVEFLLKIFGDKDPYKSAKENWKEELQPLAEKAASDYLEYKRAAKARGDLQYKRIPCTNHPVFKGKPVNIDPREDYVRGLFRKSDIVNPFIEFYHYLVEALFQVGVTKNVFCVNIDAVLAAVSLELMWKQAKDGKISPKDMQDIVFSIFLVGRMVGSNAEIIDHRSRGLDMDCRTPASEVSTVK
jgi:citrate synthase